MGRNGPTRIGNGFLGCADVGYKIVFSPPSDTDPPTNAIWTRDNIFAPYNASSSGGGSVQQSIASATTTDLGTLTTTSALVTGSTTITGFGATAPAGTLFNVEFSGVLTITYDAVKLITPGAANITTAAGDFMWAISLGAGNWRILEYSFAGTVNRALTFSGAVTFSGATTFSGNTTMGAASGVSLIVNAVSGTHPEQIEDSNLAGPYNVGYLEIPPMVGSPFSAGHTAIKSDSGKLAVTNGSLTFTIPANATIAYPIGTAFTVYNENASAATIAVTSDTLVWSPAGTTGNRTLAQYGLCTVVKVLATTWVITGTGLT